MISKTRLCHIVACNEQGVIGIDGQLPWHLPKDLKFFKATTMGGAIIMGRKTYDSIGRPLPGRLNLVLSRVAKPTTDQSKLIYVQNLEDAVAQIAPPWRQDEIYIIGGAEIYNATLDQVDKVYLTAVSQEIVGDAYYPLEKLKRQFVRTHAQPELDGETKIDMQVWVRK